MHTPNFLKRFMGIVLWAIVLVQFLSGMPLKAQNSPPFIDESSRWVDSLMAMMDLDHKVGQLFMVAAYSNRDDAHRDEILRLIEDYHIGGLIFFQGGPVRQAQLSNHFQESAKIPLLIAMDAEWGLGMRLDSTFRYPYQMALGAIHDNQLIYDMGADIARQFHRLGMHINFAPVIDVNNNANNPVINFRSFGEDKYKVSDKGLSYMKGMQDHGILASGKHFPGHGDTDTDSHKDLPVIAHPRERLNDVELYPFTRLMKEGLGSVMVAHLSIPSLDATPDLPSTLSHRIVTDLLKDSLQFEGLAFTDALNMEGVAKYYEPGEVDLRALIAGNDVLLFSKNVPRGIELIKEAVREGRIQEGMIDQKVRKILELKYWAGLNQVEPVDMKDLVKDLNDPKEEVLLRKLYSSSLTVIKNDNDLLPLKRLDTLRVISVTLGSEGRNEFHQRLDSYMPVDHLFIKEGFSLESIRQLLEPYNLCILNMSGLSQYASRNFGLTEPEIEAANALIGLKKTILVWHGNPYGLVKIDRFENSQSTIISYQENRYTHDYAAQLIFGGVGATGTLPVRINERFPAGWGIPTEGAIRFSYTIPEEAGLDSDYLVRKLDSMAVYTLENQVAPGVQVLVAKDQKIVYHKAFGFHTYDSLQDVALDDLYDFASVSKITTALPALMRFHDQNTFDLDATLGDYLTYFRRGNKKDIPIRRILSHNAGLQSWIPYWRTTLKQNGKFKRRTLTSQYSDKYSIKLNDSLYLYTNYRDKIYKMIKKSPVDPSQGYLYSGLSFYLWPQVVADLAGQDFEEHLKSTFYRPLGANTLTYNPSKHFPVDRIIPTENDTFFRKMQIHGVVHDEGAAMMDGVSANAGLFGSATDLAKLMQMYMNLGEYGGERYISINTVKKFTSCQYCNEGVRRGLAFDRPLIDHRENGMPARDAGENSFGHSGYTGTFTWADPDTGILFIFFSNRVYPTRDNNKISQLNIRPTMHQIVYDARIDKN